MEKIPRTILNMEPITIYVGLTGGWTTSITGRVMAIPRLTNLVMVLMGCALLLETLTMLVILNSLLTQCSLPSVTMH